MTTFGSRIRLLRLAEGLSQKRLAATIGVHHTYLSKVESGKLDFALYPGEEVIRRLAATLGADETELLLLARKVPPSIRDRVLERPDAFRKLATLDDASLDEIIRHIDHAGRDAREHLMKCRNRARCPRFCQHFCQRI